MVNPVLLGCQGNQVSDRTLYCFNIHNYCDFILYKRIFLLLSAKVIRETEVLLVHLGFQVFLALKETSAFPVSQVLRVPVALRDLQDRLCRVLKAIKDCLDHLEEQVKHLATVCHHVNCLNLLPGFLTLEKTTHGRDRLVQHVL